MGNVKKVVIILSVFLIVAVLLAAWFYTPAPRPVYAQFINITVTDVNGDGVYFGEVAPGSGNIGDVAQNGTGAVQITVSAETSVNCSIQIRGSGDFADDNSHKLLLKKATWNVTDNVSESTPMLTTYETIAHSTAYTEEIVHVWHWLSVPSDQYAATYSTTFFYRAIMQ